MTAQRVKFVVWGTTLVWIPLALASALPAMFAVMAFDAPGSERNPATIALVAATMSFPLVAIVAVLESWNRYRQGSFALACRWACLPLVNLAVAAAGVAWITFVQGGRFAG